jgi:hypothetical protein
MTPCGSSNNRRIVGTYRCPSWGTLSLTGRFSVSLHLFMEVTCCSKTSVFIRSTRRHIPERTILHSALSRTDGTPSPVSEHHSASFNWRYKQYFPPNLWYLPTKLHGVIARKTSLFTLTKISNAICQCIREHSVVLLISFLQQNDTREVLTGQ